MNDPTFHEILYCRYPYVIISNIHRVPQDDFAFIELQGCLKLPIRPLLDTFVQQYFLHVHPALPVVSEHDFWELYDGHKTQAQSYQNTISLLLFQAMLFAASPFVSQSTVRALGYSSTRALRATLLRRAKLLHDLETEPSFVIIAQASILLSTASLSSSGKPNTMWLNLAIQNAKLAEAHLYRNITSVSDAKQCNTLKRLWWCCITRDCSISLLLKRPIQITRENFDFVGDPLSAKDIEDEVDRSRVYSPPVKRELAEILSLSTQLFLELIDALMLIYPPSGKQPSIQQEVDKALLEIDEIKFGLEAWHSRATSFLQSHRNPAGVRNSSEMDQDSGHDSVTLYTNLMFMYYHTARISLCHYQALQLDLSTSATNSTISFIARDPLRVSESRTELRAAISDVTECHKELLRFRLVQWLPHLAMGFSTLPLVLYLLDARLSPLTRDSIQQSKSMSTQNQLSILIEFMKVYCTRYESLDWITSIVHNVINFALLSPSITKESTGTDWLSILAVQPRSYLCLVSMLDISLNKGRLAQVGDFPAHLRGIVTLNLNNSKEPVMSQRRVSNESSKISNEEAIQASQFDASVHNLVQLQPLGHDDCLLSTPDSGNMFHQSTEDDSCPGQESNARPLLLDSLTMSIVKKKKESHNECIENRVLEGGGTTKADAGGLDVEYQAGFPFEFGITPSRSVDGSLEDLLGHPLV
ncbi:hypothetical protein ACJA88_015342 [Fusarium oxysporum]